jgi:predicted DNA-binding transcriptional regulator AlpA
MSAQLALPQRYLRTKEAAVILGLSTRTLEKHRTHGTGPKYSKVGGRVLYAVNDLTAWAECGAKRSTSDPETILLPKPIDPVRHVKQVPDDAIIVGGEVTSPAMMGIPEAARFLGLSVQTLAKHRTYGTGPKYHKVGRRILYAESDLTEWTERGAKRSTSDPETVRPARPASPADPVKPIKLVSESPIVVELEVAEPARLADGANLIEPVPDSAVAVEVDPIGLAKPVDEVNVVESVPDSAVAEVEAVEATKLSTRQGIHGTKPKYRLPSSWMMPSATIAARGSNSVNCSRRRGAARTDQAGWPAQIASLPRQLAQLTGGERTQASMRFSRWIFFANGGVGLPARLEQVMDPQALVLRRPVCMIRPSRAAGVTEDEDPLLIVHEGLRLGEVEARRVWQRD